jgi:hypothetical protein
MITIKQLFNQQLILLLASLVLISIEGVVTSEDEGAVSEVVLFMMVTMVITLFIEKVWYARCVINLTIRLRSVIIGLTLLIMTLLPNPLTFMA